jgi:hypothetical protein
MGFFRNQPFVLETTDSPRPIDYSVSDNRGEESDQVTQVVGITPTVMCPDGDVHHIREVSQPG